MFKRRPKGYTRLNNPDTGKIGHTDTRHRTKTFSKHNTMQKIKQISNMDLTKN